MNELWNRMRKWWKSLEAPGRCYVCGKKLMMWNRTGYVYTEIRGKAYRSLLCGEHYEAWFKFNALRSSIASKVRKQLRGRKQNVS